MIDAVILTQSEEEFAPPETPVLHIGVVEADAFLTICRYDETHDTTTMRTLAAVTVPIADLLLALKTLRGGGS